MPSKDKKRKKSGKSGEDPSETRLHLLATSSRDAVMRVRLRDSRIHADLAEVLSMGTAPVRSYATIDAEGRPDGLLTIDLRNVFAIEGPPAA